MYGLIIHERWLRKILDGSKTWEIRGSRTSKRGEIALIQKGSGKIFGTCELTGVIGPLSKSDLEANRGKHQVPIDEMSDVIGRYAKPYAWVISDVKRLETPFEYHHPIGAVVWVRVGDLG
jgi:hypothetical protein